MTKINVKNVIKYQKYLCFKNVNVSKKLKINSNFSNVESYIYISLINNVLKIKVYTN